MSDTDDSDYPRFVTCVGCGQHGHFILNGKKSKDVNSKAEGRVLLDTSVSSAMITPADKETLLPLLEASTIPEEDLLLEQLLDQIFPSADEFAQLLLGLSPERAESRVGLPATQTPGFQMALDVTGELPHGFFYTEHAMVTPVVFSKSDGRAMLENAKAMGVSSDSMLATLLAELEASALPEVRPTYAEFAAIAGDKFEPLMGAQLLVCNCGNPVVHAYYHIDGEKASLPIASKAEGRDELFALLEDDLLTHYAHGALLVQLEESDFPELPPARPPRNPPDEASASFH